MRLLNLLSLRQLSRPRFLFGVPDLPRQKLLLLFALPFNQDLLLLNPLQLLLQLNHLSLQHVFLLNAILPDLSLHFNLQSIHQPFVFLVQTVIHVQVSLKLMLELLGLP